MKKLGAVIVVLILAVLMAGTTFAQDYMFPRKNNFGLVGKDGRAYKVGWFMTLYFEGETSDGYETSVSVTDPTADRTIVFPDASGTVVLTSIAEAANAVWFDTNKIAFEGATANTIETFIIPVDPTVEDRTLTLPNASGTFVLSTLATNAPEIANSVWGASNAWVFEGATANDHETSITVVDPTATRTFTLPNASGVAVISALATNAPEIANSVWGVSNGWRFEGATANDHETTITPADPTATRTITLPDASGTVALNGTASHDYDAGTGDWTMTVAEANCSFITVTNAGGAVNAILPAAIPGKTYLIYNGSGAVLTFLVDGQAGGTIANGKYALYVCHATDVYEIYEQS